MTPAKEINKQASESPDGCSKCGNALDTEGYPLWCKACRAKHQREYQSLRLTMTEAKAFRKGVEAMRELLVSEFEGLGSSNFTGAESAYLIRQAPGPQVE